MEERKTVMHGRWWDSKKAKEFAGDLIIEYGKITLQVSEMKNPQHIWDSKNNYFEIIFGEIFNGSAVTVFGCYPISEMQKASGFTRYEFQCKEVWFNCHIEDKNTIECKALYAEIPDFDLWLKQKAYLSMSQYKHHISNDISISFNYENEYYHEEIDNIDIKFISSNTPNFLSKNFELSSIFSIKMSPKKICNFQELMFNLDNYVILLSILYGRVIKPESIYLEIMLDGQVLRVSLCPPFEKKVSRRAVESIAFFFPEVAQKIPDMIQKIGQLLDKNRESISILFLKKNDYEFKDYDSIRRDFLELCHVAEGIITDLPSSKIIDAKIFKEFKKKMEELLVAIGDKTFLEINKNRMGHWNEQVLAGKLEGFISGFDSNFVNSIKISKKDISKIVATRNYYAHMTSTKPKNVANYSEMFSYNWKLLFMIYIYMLKVLGINERDAVYNLGSTEQFRGVLDFNIYNS